MPSRKEIVEQALGVRVPDQYAAYLEKYGIFHTFGIEVYGISDDLSTYDGVPCVIGATKMYRLDENLPHRFLVLQHTGIEDEFICLDTQDEKVYSMSWDLGNRKVADSFDEWFQRDIIEYSQRSGPSKYDGAKIIPID